MCHMLPHVASDDGSIFEWDSAMTYSLLLLSPLLFISPYLPPRTHLTTTTQPSKMTWQPQQQGLEEVLSMLRSSSSGDSEVQKAVSHVRSKFPFITSSTLLYSSKFLQGRVADYSASRGTPLQPRFPRLPRSRPYTSTK